MRGYGNWPCLGLGQTTEPVYFAEKAGKIIPSAP